MCGIIGYIGNTSATPILLEGLRRLEYRGYDSSGLAVLNDGGLVIRKREGRIANLAEWIDREPLAGNQGISHTRWATHGGVTDANAHPHCDQSGRLALVHNGVIENYRQLQEELAAKGHTFQSETDSEVLAHLVGEAFDALDGGSLAPRNRLVEALRRALRQVTGTYGVAVMHEAVPGVIVGARRGSPLVLGIGKGEHFLASDVGAMVAHTREAVYLQDGDLVAVEGDGFEMTTLGGGRAGYEINTVDFTEGDAVKGAYPHYMLKEIFEQPETIGDAMRGRISRTEAMPKLGGLEMNAKELRAVERIVLTGCGTAAHAGMVGEYLLESLAHLPTEVEFASELRYRNMPMGRDTLVIAISQSGETADTLAALRECQRKGHRTLAICNNVASTIGRESDGGVYMHAGPEIGVAATKSFTSQVTILTLLGILLGRIRHLSTTEGIEMLEALESIPEKVRAILDQSDKIKAIAAKYIDAKAMMFLGRQYNYPVAMEGALKMKEISYIHAEGHPSAELKHGVIALISPEVPSVFIAPDDAVFGKNLSNMEEVKARRGPVIAIGTEGNRELAQVADDVIYIPPCPDFLSPLLTVIPLQLLAYHFAAQLGCDIDKPRNLAKSVTVE
ncbi:MAG TPA: glutamine--fructose-6-phosphate transaminase (isomerizing) [Chthoniobacteraceae bacterium]|nr:glutamine--fructose-6-phosphate transaminase (isomerizing) [Chthoniobacteraceae bacterium]